MSSRIPQIVSEPVAWRRSIARLFDGLDGYQQRALIDQLALMPRDIERLVSEGVVARETLRPLHDSPAGE